MTGDSQHIHFVTGRLAEHAVRKTVHDVAEKIGFQYSIDVLPITVAALITPQWLMRHIKIPEQSTRVILPGYLMNDIEEIKSQFTIPVDAGPRDIRDLPLFFGEKQQRDRNYGSHSIEILAEINHAPRLSITQLIADAQRLANEGADIIDLGCSPGHRWKEVGTAVRELRATGLRVSIDSFEAWEVQSACAAGAELVLSVNSSNSHAALDWGAEVVVIPDVPGDKKSLEKSVDFLVQHSIPIRLDPILEPLGCGFATSLQRYFDCRKNFPDASMLMGIGNITELTDADSAGINVLLLGICQEIGIQSVLTTEVINWAATSVQECDLARKLVHFAYTNQIPPKHLEPNLVLLRDERVNQFDMETISKLAESIRDNNIRIMNCDGKIHVVSSGIHIQHEDPFAAMQELLESKVGSTLTPSHAFYLGFEMAKALTANTLNKQYTQDEALNWGYLTRPEDHHRLARQNRVSRNLELPESDTEF